MPETVGSNSIWADVELEIAMHYANEPGNHEYLERVAICNKCGALVFAQPDFTQAHEAFHRKVGA